MIDKVNKMLLQVVMHLKLNNNAEASVFVYCLEDLFYVPKN